MTRKEKIKALQAISEGRLRIENLEPPQVYVFIERSNQPGVYERDGKEYTEAEYREFCENINRRCNNSIIWNEGKQFPPEDIIITLCNPDNKTKSLDPTLTVDFS